MFDPIDPQDDHARARALTAQHLRQLADRVDSGEDAAVVLISVINGCTNCAIHSGPNGPTNADMGALFFTLEEVRFEMIRHQNECRRRQG